MTPGFDAAAAEWEATWRDGPPVDPPDDDEGGPDYEPAGTPAPDDDGVPY